MEQFIIYIDDKWSMVTQKGIKELKESDSYKVTKARSKGRTTVQNSALHKYFSLLADELNNAGFDVATTLSKSSTDSIKRLFNWSREKIPTKYHKVLSKVEDRLIDDLSGKVEWTMLLVKEVLWKPLQEAILGKKSTTSLDKTGDIKKVYLALDKIISERTGITVAFPSVESMLFEKNHNNKELNK